MITTIVVSILTFMVGSILFYTIAKSKYSSQLNTSEVLVNERENHIEELKIKADQDLDQIERLRQHISTLENDAARLETRIEEERKQSEEKLKLLTEAEESMSNKFESLSSKILKSNSEEFMNHARKVLEVVNTEAKGDLDKRKQAVEELVKPLRESLEKMNQQVNELDKKRVGDSESLKKQLEMMVTSQEKLENVTKQLNTAMRSTSSRGKWGELALERVVEYAGMTNHVDFTEQVTIGSGERPDMIVHLPSDKNIIIDSKTPMDAYLRAMDTDDPVMKENELRTHAEHVRKHMMDLSKKGYWNTLSPTPEFVVMFIPAESIFSDAVRIDPTLIGQSAEKRVIIATPTTLIALLKAIAYGWQQEEAWKNAQNIVGVGQELYERIGVLSSHFTKLGKSLQSSVSNYNKAVSSIESRVLVSARKLNSIGSGTSKDILPVEPVDSTARELTAQEFIELPEGDEKPT